MDPHLNLVNSLIAAFLGKGYVILKASNGSYPAPESIGRHEPDILAQDSSGLLHIGEAKTVNDVSSQLTKEQFTDFSSRIMSEGPLRGSKVPLHIIVPNDQSDTLRQVLAELGLSNKIGESIYIWTD